ncbi:hypothetical protein A3F64_02140 [Candidatus Saccharibacteria bacterium RIFCSPHIGHO2_12_FULL_42_8]|nr:MAG: hypothetical protein A3F64_02140 [Candidatus Saccharibacteria bacterium RIFCSPHIGHO2_12_FULL_42_8]
MPAKIIVAYVPVLHAGYKKFFDQNPEAKKLYLLGPGIIKSFRPIQKDARALTPQSAKNALQGWERFNEIQIIEIEGLKALNSDVQEVFMPNEDISHELAHTYLTKSKVTFFPIFLRWDRKSSNAKDTVTADITISKDTFDKAALKTAYKESEKSSDIWRRVGAVLTKNGKVIAAAYNQSTPSIYSASTLGDPRNNFNKGTDIDRSIFIHAEAKLIAEAAKEGVKLEGLDLYVTTFPCPTCAKLIAFSGIERLFFTEGYGVLDGENVLKTHNVQLIKVDVEPPQDTQSSLPYPEK